MLYDFSKFFTKPVRIENKNKKILIINKVEDRIWKEKNIQDYNRVIFLGNYFTYNKKHKFVVNTYKEIIHLKQLFSNKIKLLLNGYDLQYIFYYEKEQKLIHKLSMNYNYGWKYKKMLQEYKHYFDIYYLEDNILYTYGGLSQLFWDKLGIEYLHEIENLYKQKNIKLFTEDSFFYINNGIKIRKYIQVYSGDKTEQEEQNYKVFDYYELSY